MKMKKNLIYAIYLICSVLLLLTIVDFVARMYCQSRFNTSSPVLFNLKRGVANTAPDATFVHHAHNIIDPHLGALWNAAEHENFVAYYKGKVFKSLII